MTAALVITVVSIGLGSAIGLLRGPTDRFTGPAQTFALVSVLTVVCARLLPDALAELGLRAFVPFGAAFLAPGMIERLARSGKRGSVSSLGLELGYLGLLLHQLGEGFVLGAYSGQLQGGQVHMDVLLAVGAHTVPVAALMVLLYRRRSGTPAAVRRALGLALITVGGIALAAAAPLDRAGGWEPWLSAAVSGLLLHVVAHGMHDEPLTSDRRRLSDLLAVVLGAGLVLLAGDSTHSHHGGADPHDSIAVAFVELLFETAPLLLFGLAVGAALQLFGSRLPIRSLSRGSHLSQAVRGAVIGAPLPVCACGVLPIAQSLRARGGGAALVVAFLLSTPELGVETFALTVRFLGWPFAVTRLLAAVGVAVVVAWLVARSGERADPGLGAGVEYDSPLGSDPPRGGIGSRLLGHFDELLYHVGPWTLVGLLAAAYVEVALDERALDALAHSGLDIPVVMLIAVPSYVCASSATPFAAVLLAKGLSPGAVLAGLLLGPATNVATFGWLRGSFGTRATLVGVIGLVAICWALALGVNAAALHPTPRVTAAFAHEHGWLTLTSVLVLITFVLRGIWQAGLRTWLGSLGESLGHARHRHGHDHAHSH